MQFVRGGAAARHAERVATEGSARRASSRADDRRDLGSESSIARIIFACGSCRR